MFSSHNIKELTFFLPDEESGCTPNFSALDEILENFIVVGFAKNAGCINDIVGMPITIRGSEDSFFKLFKDQNQMFAFNGLDSERWFRMKMIQIFSMWTIERIISQNHILCPFCNHKLVAEKDPTKFKRYETCAEHVCDPNMVQPLRSFMKCVNPSCMAVQGEVFWSTAGELYCNYKYYKNFDNINTHPIHSWQWDSDREQEWYEKHLKEFHIGKYRIGLGFGLLSNEYSWWHYPDYVYLHCEIWKEGVRTDKYITWFTTSFW